MRFLVEETPEGQKAYGSLLTENPELFSVLSSELSQKIIKELGKQPMCAMDVARKLKEHEQKIYYHMRKLEKLGIIKLDGLENRVGAVAKIYSLTSPVVSFKLFEGGHIKDVKTKISSVKFLNPFVHTGKFDGLIIVGSPDPHGRYKAPASDGYCAINIGTFLGQFVTEIKEPFYKLDTQIRNDDLKNNLILIGGPMTNMVTEMINKQLPIYFDFSEEMRDWSIVSTLTKNIYREKYFGFIVRAPSPFAEGKEIILLAGKGFSGSRAAVLAFTTKLKEVAQGNSVKPEIMAKVVKGIDVDSDGIVDDVEFLE